MSKRSRQRVVCPTSLADLSPHDRAEVEKFRQALMVHKARKEGVDPHVCDMLEAMIYPGGIGRTPADGAPDA